MAARKNGDPTAKAAPSAPGSPALSPAMASPKTSPGFFKSSFSLSPRLKPQPLPDPTSLELGALAVGTSKTPSPRRQSLHRFFSRSSTRSNKDDLPGLVQAGPAGGIALATGVETAAPPSPPSPQILLLYEILGGRPREPAAPVSPIADSGFQAA